MTIREFTIDELLEVLEDYPFNTQTGAKGIITLFNGKIGEYSARYNDVLQKARVVGYIREGIAYLNTGNGKAKVIGTVEYER